MADDDRYPCPGTPAIADILQAVGSLAVYAVDTLLMKRLRTWNYRRISLSDAAGDGASVVGPRPGCRIVATTPVTDLFNRICISEQENGNGEMAKERIVGEGVGS